MQSILEQITDWLKSMIISGIMGNLSGMFDSVNQQVGQIAGDVGTTPANFSPAVFSMIRNIGLIRGGWGVVQGGLSFQSHDPSQRSQGFLTLAGGLVVTFAKEILDLITA